MPATESTWRNTQQLHRIFAVSGVLLTICTVWMFWKDHARSWKTYQVQINNIDLKMNDLRQQQYETGDALVQHDQRAAELAAARATPIDERRLAEFKSQATDLNDVLQKWQMAGHAYSTVAVDTKKIDDEAQELSRLAEAAQGKKKEAADARKAAEDAMSALQKKSDDATLKEFENKERAARDAEQADAAAL